MTAKLDKPLKRELIIAGQPYVLTLSTQGIKLVPKGKRKGYELWSCPVSVDGFPLGFQADSAAKPLCGNELVESSSVWLLSKFIGDTRPNAE